MPSNFNSVRIFSAILLSPFLTQCMTSSSGEEIKKEMFQLQARLLELESQVDRGGKQSKSIGHTTNVKIASTSAKIDSINEDLLKIQGDIDTLRFGLRTGELPGTGASEDSVAKIINRIHERMSAVEETQALILNKLEQKSRKKIRKPLGSLSQLKSAFKQKRYAHIKSDAPLLFGKSKGKELNLIKYYYAESLFSLGQLSEAALAFNTLLKESTLQDLHPQIQMRMGDSFRLLGDFEVAYVYYNELMEKYPQSKLIGEAKEQSQKLEAKLKK